jgi:formylmethanofuran dehydrogenase subunit E
MRSPQIQTIISVLADVITGLHEQETSMVQIRKKFNATGDELLSSSKVEEAKAYFNDADLYTPYIIKYKRKIKSLASIQRSLKHEAKCSACLEAFVLEDEEYLNSLFLAEQEGYVEPVAVQEIVGAPCELPPAGWYCTRGAGHSGPCAAYSTEE